MSEALVILSGGLDSTAALGWAKKNFETVSCIIFDYGQKHKIEIDAAKKICVNKFSRFSVVEVPFYRGSANSLNDPTMPIPTKIDGIPNTNVVGRNYLFMLLAVIEADKFGIKDIVTGIRNSYAYPDCREESLQAYQQAITLGVGEYNFWHPIFDLNREQTVNAAIEWGIFDQIKYTVTCYNGTPPCGICKPCQDREAGFRLANVVDPILGRDYNA